MRWLMLAVAVSLVGCGEDTPTPECQPVKVGECLTSCGGSISYVPVEVCDPTPEAIRAEFDRIHSQACGGRVPVGFHCEASP